MSRNSAASDRADVYTRITAEIIAAIEAGAGTWRMPGIMTAAPLPGRSTYRPANGIVV